MALFLSTFVNKVDRKGRVSVPAPFRAAIQGQSFKGIIAFRSYREAAIEACAMDRMERLSDSIDALDQFSEEQDDFASTIFADSHQLPIDGDGRIILRHLLPNAITPVLVFWMTDMALVILLGSSLGYLGLGARPPAAEWGVLIADGKNFMTTAWWISIFPGMAIVVTGLGFSMIGDGLADLLRPQR